MGDSCAQYWNAHDPLADDFGACPIDATLQINQANASGRKGTTHLQLFLQSHRLFALGTLQSGRQPNSCNTATPPIAILLLCCRWCNKCNALHLLDDFDGTRKTCRKYLTKASLKPRGPQRLSDYVCAKVRDRGGGGGVQSIQMSHVAASGLSSR